MNTPEGRMLRDFGLIGENKHPWFLKWVRKQPCILCLPHQEVLAEPHHFLGSVMGRKSSDIFTVPLCRQHHEMYQEDNKGNEDLVIKWCMLAHQYILESHYFGEGREG